MKPLGAIFLMLWAVTLAAAGDDVTLEVLEQLPGVGDIDRRDGHLRVSFRADRADPSIIARKLVEGGFKLMRLEEEKVNLETAFMRLTKGLVQ